MAILQVQKARGRATGTAPEAIYPGTPTEGNLLEATLTATSAGVAITPPAGWTAAIENTAASPSAGIYYKVAGASESATVTFALASSQAWRLHIFEYSGTATSSPLDQTSNTTGSGTTQTTADVTTTQADELITAAVMFVDNEVPQNTWTNSFTQQHIDDSFIRLETAHRIVSATGTYNTAETTGSTATWRALVATFKAAAGGTDLVIQDASHAHTADSQALTQVHNLTVADSAHGHSADVQALTQVHNLTVADAAHGHAADNLGLSQVHNLGVADASHAHSADNAVLVPEGELDVAGGTHAHSADNLNLTQVHNLQIQDASHAHVADNLVLTSPFVVQDATHGHTADNLTLTQVHQLVIADATHAHAGDNVGLSSWTPVSRRVGTATPRRQLVATPRRGG